MSQTLCFNEFTFSPVIRNNQPWFRSSELARALGYSSEKAVANIYRHNQDEFSNDMSVVINLSTTEFPAMTRIFSLRGCHLLAMFARTPVAKAFRKWVLDVIEQYGDRVPVEQHAFIPTPSTPADRKPLRSLVNAWAKLANVHQSTLWPQVRAHFQLERIDDLPVEWLPDALAWVQGKIDEVNGKPLTGTPALPAHSGPYRDRIKALTELESRFSDFAKESRFRLYQFVKEFLSIKGSTYSELLNRACDRPNLTNDPLLGILQSKSYNAQTWVDAGLTEMSTAIRAARTANKLMLG